LPTRSHQLQRPGPCSIFTLPQRGDGHVNELDFKGFSYVGHRDCECILLRTAMTWTLRALGCIPWYYKRDILFLLPSHSGIGLRGDEAVGQCAMAIERLFHSVLSAQHPAPGTAFVTGLTDSRHHRSLIFG